MKKIDISTDKFPNTFASVDDEDYDALSGYSWYAWQSKTGTIYAARSTYSENRKGVVLMHREIMQTPRGLDTDHRDRSGLNNQKFNLRICGRSRNNANCKKHTNGRTSRYLGVSFDRGKKKYLAQVQFKGKNVFFKRFPTEQEAVAARDEAAIRYYGEYASLNFPRKSV